MAGGYTGQPHPCEGKREENVGRTVRVGLPLPDSGSPDLCKAAVSRAAGRTSHEGMGQGTLDHPHPKPAHPGLPGHSVTFNEIHQGSS